MGGLLCGGVGGRLSRIRPLGRGIRLDAPNPRAFRQPPALPVDSHRWTSAALSTLRHSALLCRHRARVGWKTAKPFLESWIKDQVGIPALVRAFKDKAPFWIERMPEIPELVYQSLQQSKQLQTSVDTIVRDMHVRHVRQGQSRYLFGIGAVLLLSGTLLFIHRPEWGMMPGWLMAGGVVTWLIGWRKTR